MSTRIMLGGRAWIAEALNNQTWLFAIAAGLPAWDADPEADFNTDVAGVQNLIGYARPKIVGYAEQDPEGSIVASGGDIYAHVANPPKDLVLFQVDLLPGSYPDGTVIREVGLFMNPTIDPSVPAGQMIIPPEMVSDPGRFFMLSRFAAETMTPAKRFKRSLISRP